MDEQAPSDGLRIQIQDFVPYEESLLWSLHRDYYQQQGLQAFLRQEVPYNISSNPCLAGQALELLLAAQPQGPVDVLEIGAGLGIFAYNFLLALAERAPELELCYWISDYSAIGLQELAAQPVFAAWRGRGRLRLCLLDGRDPRDARDLDGQPLSLPPQGFGLIIANYVFSTLPTAVLMRQQDQWLRQTTRLEWLPLGPEPSAELRTGYYLLIAAQLRNYRLVDHVSPDQENYSFFAALQQAQEEVAGELEAGTPVGDFGDWLEQSLVMAWANHLAGDIAENLRPTVRQLLVIPLLDYQNAAPGQLREEHRFMPAEAAALFGEALHLNAIERLGADWPQLTLTYSPASLATLQALIGLSRPQGLILISDKAYADPDWMCGLHPETATRHGQSLAHAVNFPLFEAVLERQGLACRRTHDRAQALHSLLICAGPELPEAVARQFSTDFITYPRNEISHALLEGGHALMQLEQLEQAQRCLQRALSYRPGDAALQYLNAVCLLNQERYAEALELLERPHDDLFGSFNREILQAESYRLTGQFARALPFYTASLRYGENSQSYYNLALCQLELDDISGACASLEQAHLLDPDDSEIQELLSSLRSSL